VLGVPGSLEASSGTYSDKVELLWVAVAGAESYDIYRDEGLLQAGVTAVRFDDTTAELNPPSTVGFNFQPSEGTDSEKVVITWDEPETTTSHRYRVAARFGDVTSGQSDDATGYRSAPTVNHYRLTIDGGEPIVLATRTYEDTDAELGSVDPGSAIATNDRLVGVLAQAVGATSSPGAERTYTLRAISDAGLGETVTATGFVGGPALTYQWQESASSVDADYSNIVGATTAVYDHIDAPINGDARYYRCNVSGSLSNGDRGQRAFIELASDTAAMSDSRLVVQKEWDDDISARSYQLGATHLTEIGGIPGDIYDLFYPKSIHGDYVAGEFDLIADCEEPCTPYRELNVWAFDGEDDSWSEVFWHGVAARPTYMRSASLAGDYLLVGEPNYPAGTEEGTVWRYRNDGGWAADGQFPQLEAGSHLGTSVAIAGDLALLGAPDAADVGQVVFTRLEEDEWTEFVSITPNGLSAGDGFGTSIAVDRSGTQFIAGAPRYFSSSRGAAYIYNWTGTEWDYSVRLTSSSAGGDELGTFVAIDGAHAAVGTKHLGGDSYVRLYRSVEGSWRFYQIVAAPSQYGRVELSGPWLRVGANLYYWNE